MDKMNNYAVIAVFLVDGVQHYLIKTPGGVSTMLGKDYERIWGMEHPGHWRKRKQVA